MSENAWKFGFFLNTLKLTKMLGFRKNKGLKTKSIGIQSDFYPFSDIGCKKRPQIQYNSFVHVKYQVQQVKGIKMRSKKIFYARFINILCVFS